MRVKELIQSVVSIPDSLYNRVILKYRKVKYGRNLRIKGRIYCVSNCPDGIILGDNVSINSGYRFNPIGGDTRTILFAKGNGRIRIGNNCGLSNATIFANEAITIDDDVMLGGGVKIYDSDFHWVDYERRIHEPGGKTDPVHICSGAFIGAHTIILKGVTIGSRSVIGAGSVVTKSVPAGEIWAGNPARFVKDLKAEEK